MVNFVLRVIDIAFLANSRSSSIKKITITENNNINGNNNNNAIFLRNNTDYSLKIIRYECWQP